MTTEARCVTAEILLVVERLISQHGPFRIIASMLRAYFIEWGWVNA